MGNADASCASIPHFGVAGQPSQPGAGQPGMPRLPSLLGSVLPHGQGTSPSSGMAHDPMTGRPAETSGGEPSDACQCGSVFMLDAVFCRHCGTKRPPAPAPPLAAICPCGTAFIEGSMFCCMCGHKRIRDVASSSRSNAAAIASCDAEATLSSDAPMSSAASSSAPMSHAPASSVVDGAFSSVHNGLSSPRWAAVVTMCSMLHAANHCTLHRVHSWPNLVHAPHRNTSTHLCAFHPHSHFSLFRPSMRLPCVPP